MSKRAKKEAPKRWHVIVNFGHGQHFYDIEELDELAEIIERGPDWNLIKDITITLNRSAA